MKKLLLAVALFLAFSSSHAGFVVSPRNFNVCPYVNLTYGVTTDLFIAELSKPEEKKGNHQKARWAAFKLLADQGKLVASCTTPVMFLGVKNLLGISAADYVYGRPIESIEQTRAAVVFLLKMTKTACAK